MFWVLDRVRRYDQNGNAEAIPPSEVEAWCRMTGETLSRWEVVALAAMDVARRNAWSEEVKVTPGGPRMTPALFDNIFGSGPG